MGRHLVCHHNGHDRWIWSIAPDTDAGRVLAITIMLVGIGFVALVTAFVADRFIQRDVEDVEEKEDLILAELRRINDRLESLEAGSRSP